MGKHRSWATDAVVLRSFAIGDADTFCILFTEDSGRLAVRVRGARKPGSQMGSSFQPLSCIHVDLERHTAGITARSVSLLVSPRPTALGLSVLQEAAELVLRLTEDEHEQPELYEHCRAFFSQDRRPEEIVPFNLKLLWILGLLPLSEEDRRFAALSVPSRKALEECLGDAPPALAESALRQLKALLASLLPDHLAKPLHVPAIRAALELAALPV